MSPSITRAVPDQVAGSARDAPLTVNKIAAGLVIIVEISTSISMEMAGGELNTDQAKVELASGRAGLSWP